MLFNRRRFIGWLSALSAAPAAVHAQGNTNQPATGGDPQPKSAAGEVQAGAGTLGDVTTGSSGPRAESLQNQRPSSDHSRDNSSNTATHRASQRGSSATTLPATSQAKDQERR